MNDSNNLNPYQSPQSLEPVDDRNPGDLIVLSTFDNIYDAREFHAVLEKNGIRAVVNDDKPLLSVTVTGPSSTVWIKVLILQHDEIRALKIKSQWDSVHSDQAKVKLPEWTCQCGETVDEGFSICWNCDAEFRQDA